MFSATILKTVDQNSIQPGGRLRFYIQIKNTGPDIPGFILFVRDPFRVQDFDLSNAEFTIDGQQTSGPGNFSFSLNITPPNPTVTALFLNTETFPGGAITTFTLEATVNPSRLSSISSIRNTAQLEVDGRTLGFSTANFSDVAVIVRGPVTTTKKTKKITYLIVVTNNGPFPATGVTLNDRLSPGLTLDTFRQVSGPLFTLGPGFITSLASIAVLDVGVSAAFEVVSKLCQHSALTNVSNSATVYSTSVDSYLNNNTSTAQTILLNC